MSLSGTGRDHATLEWRLRVVRFQQFAHQHAGTVEHPRGRIQGLLRMHDDGPIGDAMVAPHNECAAALDVVHHNHLPQGLRAVQRRAGKVADQRPQGHLVVGCGQGDVVQMLVDFEVRHVLPVPRWQREADLHHALAKTLKAEQPFPVNRAHFVEVKRLLRQQQARHDAQIGRAVHVVPRGVDRAHGVGCHGAPLNPAINSPQQAGPACGLLAAPMLVPTSMHALIVIKRHQLCCA
jgi:hypothetical protein